MKFFGVAVFGLTALVGTLLTLWTTIAWPLYLPVALLLWLLFFVSIIHAFRPRF